MTKISALFPDSCTFWRDYKPWIISWPLYYFNLTELSLDPYPSHMDLIPELLSGRGSLRPHFNSLKFSVTILKPPELFLDLSSFWIGYSPRYYFLAPVFSDMTVLVDINIIIFINYLPVSHLWQNNKTLQKILTALLPVITIKTRIISWPLYSGQNLWWPEVWWSGGLSQGRGDTQDNQLNKNRYFCWFLWSENRFLKHCHLHLFHETSAFGFLKQSPHFVL